MEFLASFLPIIIYILLIVLLVVGIILGIRLIITIDKVNIIMDSVNDKLTALDGVFNIVKTVNNKFNLITDKISDVVMSLFSKLPIFKNRKEEDDYE